MDDNANSFLVQLSTWDLEELKEKLEKREQNSKQTMEKMISSLQTLLLRTNRLQSLANFNGKRPRIFIIIKTCTEETYYDLASSEYENEIE